jgi:mannose-1-phosphate guanylyltransferase
MVPLFGVPFLERTLVRLREAGVSDVILASGYLPRAIEDHFGDGARLGLKLTYVVETEPLGTAGALRNVADHLHGTFFVLNGDVLTSLDLKAMIDFHRISGGIGVLHAISVEDPSAFGCIVRDDDNRITSFVEKPPREEAPTNEINAGTYLLERRVLDAIPAGRAVSIERETFPKLLAAGERLYSYVTDDYWLDVGRPQQYLQAHGDVLDGKLVLALSGDLLPERGTYWYEGANNLPSNVKPPVYLGHDVSIDVRATIGPYAVIGERCRVAKDATVSDSIVWDDVEIGEGAQVADAILASKVRIGPGAVVTSGAVIGHDVHVPPDTILEPEARIRAEVNATTERVSKV